LTGGYNAYNDNFNVPVADHGTHVSGILGAISNNSEGVAGVMWNAEVFPVAGSSINETVVVRAYDYILGLRQDYNNSGGSSGRFIVATNSSFGVDYGDPADYGCWCAMYDAMGAVGIISVAATINDNVNVDQVGDVPTGCASDYLISVTNTDHNDTRNSLAGYGANSIDLGAPGTNIRSTLTLDSGSYGYDTGASMATPHVTGVAGLIYSVLSTVDIANSLTNPGPLALSVKDYILNNVDPIADLSGITTTGGRLNAYEAVKHALPNQFNSPFFAVWPSQDIGGSHIFGDSYLEFGTLIIPQGKAAVFSGTLTGFGGDYAKILVQGNMVVESGTQLLDLSIEVSPTGRLIVRDGATIRPGSLGELLVEGYARLGSDVVVRRGDIEVGAGGELVVGAGSTLYFNSGASLTSYGKVEIGSHAGADVILARDPNVGGSWAGVHLNGAGADGAVNGITITNAGSVTLNQIRAIDNTWDGIRLINTATGWLEWVTATGNGRYGIYIDGGTPGNISSTLLADNINAGINIEGAGWIWDIYTSRIRDNASQGLWARDAAFLGINFSSIHDNANYNAASWSGAEIIAWDNWWGQTPPNPNGFHTMTGGTLDYSGWLSWDPNGGILSMSEGEALATAENPTGRQPRIPPKPEQVRTLSDLRAELFHTGASERLSRVEELSANMEPGWQPWAQVVVLEMLQQAGRHRDLVQAGGIVLAEAGLPAGVRRTIARRMFYSHLLGLEEPELARALITTLEELECDEALDGQLAWLLDFYAGKDGSGEEQEMASTAPDALILQASSHPNPFNPTTTIRYTLPVAAEVTLTVYNIQGQQVATLVRGQQPEGAHTAGFDASRLASGVYVYRLLSGGQMLTGKMLLVK